MSEPVLQVEGLSAAYGSAQALFDISFTLQGSNSLAILGSNGAGKSTLALALCGLVPSTGRILLAGEEIQNWSPYRIRRSGLSYLPEGRGIFPALSVEENLRMATLWSTDAVARRSGLHRAYELFPVLGQRRSQQAGTLSGGEQQMLSLARGLAINPRVLIADEVSLGLAPLMIDAVFEGLRRARDEGVIVIIIEQFVHRALEFADRCLLMQRGSAAWQGDSADAHHEVLDKYLGQVA